MRTAAFVVARSRAFNLAQSTPARLRDLAKLFAILREIGSRPVTEACAPVIDFEPAGFRRVHAFSFPKLAACVSKTAEMFTIRRSQFSK
jgi:hypothetical protein